MTKQLYAQNTTSNLIGLNNDSIELGSNYLAIKAPLDEKQLSEVFGALRKMNGSTLFWIGDYLNFSTLSRGEAYARAQVETDYDKGTLMNAKSVCKYLPRELRVNLSYKHHQDALGLAKDNVALAVDFLRKAEVANWSCKQLRQNMNDALGGNRKKQTLANLTYADLEQLELQKASKIFRHFLENVTSSTFDIHKEYVKAELQTLAEWAANVCG